MYDMEEKEGRSGWTFSGDADGGTVNLSEYMFDERERSILNEFGWNNILPSTEYCEDGIPALDPSTRDFHGSSGLAETHGKPESRSQAAVASPSTAKSGDAAPSVSSSSSDEPMEKPPEPDHDKSAEIANKSKKKGQKRVRLPRFAFMTKSEVDHLEDGYRWRKYGQKAVKNSPYPRSYYRCTNSKCSVKKRVERSCEDPTIVITTYEGQHCHHTVGFSRGIASSATTPHESMYAAQLSASTSSINPFHFPAASRQLIRVSDPINTNIVTTTQQYSSFHMRYSSSSHDQAGHARAASADHAPQMPTDDGLLDDVVPAGALMRAQQMRTSTRFEGP
ncbi:hypothetical protein H6P81_019920 [Aristolochia fimbriata]|uniref:WRKY domain-containing protein n=1 Tax=Aristolochia fimbriata TaxID=158543 RepID=A0AAV7DT43_ARIFI|nr:hypothetical protein H6P81_019920 [Aristolochia fimbriata]